MHLRRSQASGSGTVLGFFGSPLCSSVPLAGTFGITDVSVGVLKPFTSLCTYLNTFSVFAWLSSPPGRSKHNLVLLIDKSGTFGSSVHLLTRCCMYSAVFMWFTTPCMSTQMFGVPTQLLDSARSFVGRLSGLTGKSGGFVYLNIY